MNENPYRLSDYGWFQGFYGAVKMSLCWLLLSRYRSKIIVGKPSILYPDGFTDRITWSLPWSWNTGWHFGRHSSYRKVHGEYRWMDSQEVKV